MATLLSGTGYGQVEPNRCSFLHDGNIESQCEAKADLENGWIVKVNKAAKEVTKYTTGDSSAFVGLIGLNYTAERIYESTTGLKNYITKSGQYPRVGYLKAGDVFTTNAFATTMTVGAIDAAIPTGLYATVGTDGPCGLDTTQPDGDFGLQIVERTTMPDGQAALKVQVIPGK